MISVSQPHAGAWLNAVPSRKAFRINSWAMRIAVQRRLGLPLTAHAAHGEEGRGKHGRPHDVMGDLAQNERRRGGAPVAALAGPRHAGGGPPGGVTLAPGRGMSLRTTAATATPGRTSPSRGWGREGACTSATPR